jgi:hypothetical protein
MRRTTHRLTGKNNETYVAGSVRQSDEPAVGVGHDPIRTGLVSEPGLAAPL